MTIFVLTSQNMPTMPQRILIGNSLLGLRSKSIQGPVRATKMFRGRLSQQKSPEIHSVYLADFTICMAVLLLVSRTKTNMATCVCKFGSLSARSNVETAARGSLLHRRNGSSHPEFIALHCLLIASNCPPHILGRQP